MQNQPLSSDGELPESVTKSLQEVIEGDLTTTHSRDWRKRKASYATAPITLWDRPYADSAGYQKVKLFVDPDPLGGWGYIVILNWILDPKLPISSEQTRTLQGNGFPTEDDAIEAGIAAYRQRLVDAQEAKDNQKPYWDKVKAYTPICIAIVAAIIALAIAVAMVIGTTITGVEFAGAFAIPVVLGFLIACTAAVIEEDQR